MERGQRKEDDRRLKVVGIDHDSIEPQRQVGLAAIVGHPRFDRALTEQSA